MARGDVRIVITVDDSGAVRAVRALGGEVEEISKKAEGFKRAWDGAFNSLHVAVGNLIADFTRLVSSEVFNFFRGSIDQAIEFEQATAGLRATVNAFVPDVVNLTEVMSDLTESGFLAPADAAESLRQLLSAGIGFPEAIEFIKKATQHARFFRQAGLSVGEAVVRTAQGIKMQNSVLTDSAGITKNLSVAWKEYAREVGKSVADLSDAEKAHAFVTIAMREMEKTLSGVDDSMLTAADRMALFKGRMREAQQEIGQALLPALNNLMDTFVEFLPRIKVLAEVIAAVPSAFELAVNAISLAMNSLAVAGLSVLEGLSKAVDFVRDKIVVVFEAFAGIGSKLPLVGDKFKQLSAALLNLPKGASETTRSLKSLREAFQEQIVRDSNKAVNAWNKMTKVLSQVGREGKKTADILAGGMGGSPMDQAGAKAEKLTKELKTLSQSLTQLHTAWARVGNGTATADAFFKQFGKTIENLDQQMKAGILPPLEEWPKQLRVIFEEFQRLASIEPFVPIEEGLRGIGEAMDQAMNDVNDLQTQLDVEFAESTIQSFKKVAEESVTAWDRMTHAMGELLADLLNQINGFISDFFAGLFGVGKGIVQFFGGIGAQIGASLKDTFTKVLPGILSQIGGSIAPVIGNIVGSLVGSLIGAIGKIFGGKSRVEKLVEQWNISKQLAEQISADADRIGNTWAAVMLHMDDIIREHGTGSIQDLNKATQDLHSVLSALDEGFITTEEAIETIGSGFQQLVDAMEKFGDVGNQQIIALMRDLQNRGLKVPEVLEFINKQVDKLAQSFEILSDAILRDGEITASEMQFIASTATAAFNEVIKNGGTFIEALSRISEPLKTLQQHFQELGIDAPKQLKKLFRLNRLVEANQELIQSIDAVRLGLEGLANVGALTAADVASAQDMLKQNFNELLEAGFKQNEALAMIAPTLEVLRTAAQNYGIALDEDTQKLIE